MKHEKEQVKTRKKLKFKFKIILMIIFTILYAFFIGTKGIFIKDIIVKSKSINHDLNGIKIVQFSDLHYGSNIGKTEVKSLIKKINISKPDIVIFTGDLIDEDYDTTKKEIEFLKKQFSLITAEYGKYYITGEEDFDTAKLVLNNSNFTNLANGNQAVFINKTEVLLIEKENSENYFKNENNKPTYKVLALHNPDDFNKLKDYNFDLAIAGHTHNGQINIPKLKNLLIDSDYKETYKKINNTKLYVNPGIGNSKINARLFNHPTIYLYRLKSTSNS